MTTDFSKLRFAAHPDGRTAMRVPDDLEDEIPWGVREDSGEHYGWLSDDIMNDEGFRPAHLLTNLTDSLIAGVETLGIPAWEAYPDGEIPKGVPFVTVWDDGHMAVAPKAYTGSVRTRGYGYRRFLLAPTAPSRPEGAEAVQSALAAAGVEVTPEQADELAKAGLRATGDES